MLSFNLSGYKTHYKTTTMVLSAVQTTMFFEDLAYMGIPHPTVIQLQQEGIIIVDDISDFDKTIIKQLAVNLFSP